MWLRRKEKQILIWEVSHFLFTVQAELYVDEDKSSPHFLLQNSWETVAWTVIYLILFLLSICLHFEKSVIFLNEHSIGRHSRVAPGRCSLMRFFFYLRAFNTASPTAEMVSDGQPWQAFSGGILVTAVDCSFEYFKEKVISSDVHLSVCQVVVYHTAFFHLLNSKWKIQSHSSGTSRNTGPNTDTYTTEVDESLFPWTILEWLTVYRQTKHLVFCKNFYLLPSSLPHQATFLFKPVVKYGDYLGLALYHFSVFSHKKQGYILMYWITTTKVDTVWIKHKKYNLKIYLRRV